MGKCHNITHNPTFIDYLSLLNRKDSHYKGLGANGNVSLLIDSFNRRFIIPV